MAAVVSGISVVCSLGESYSEIKRSILAQKVGYGEVPEHRLTPDFPVRRAACITRLGALQSLELERFSAFHFRMHLLRHLLESPDLQLDNKDPLDAVIIGHEGSSSVMIDELRSADPWCQSQEGYNAIVHQEARAQWIHEWLLQKSFTLPRRRIITINNTCASFNIGINWARQMILSQGWKRVLVGALDDRMWFSFYRLIAMGAAAPFNDTQQGDSVPFSATRRGLTRGEGAGFALIEDEATARKAGRKIYAVLRGGGHSNDAYRLTDPKPDASAAAHSISQALQTACLLQDEIDVVSTHGTATPLNDTIEAKALHQALGAHGARVAITASKSQIGHCLVACGAVEMAFCLTMLEEQHVLPIVGLQDPDASLNLNLQRQLQPRQVRHILKNNFGFGGHNCSVIYSRHESSC